MSANDSGSSTTSNKARKAKTKRQNTRHQNPAIDGHSGKIIEKLKLAYPDAHCELVHRNAFELLVATILSAQCTDARVNQVTPALFSKFPNAEAMEKASLQEMEESLSSINFFRNKAKNLISMSQELVRSHGGEVPKDMNALVALAGVGRKTANVVLGNAFGIASGVVVDTHVARLSQRFGWTKLKEPEKIERDLLKIVPETDWILISHLLIFHGRKVCSARGPKCDSCFLVDLCARRGVQ